MEELAPVYFRPRADPTYTYFLYDDYLKQAKVPDEGYVESLKKVFPKYVKLESAKGYLISNRIPISTIISTDPEAYLTINGGRTIKIGVGQFSLPTSACQAVEFKLFHAGPVTIEVRSVEVETEEDLQKVIFNLVFPENKDGEIFCIDSGLVVGPGEPKKPEEQPAEFHGDSTRKIITRLKEAGILFDSP